MSKQSFSRLAFGCSAPILNLPTIDSNHGLLGLLIMQSIIPRCKIAENVKVSTIPSNVLSQGENALYFNTDEISLK